MTDGYWHCGITGDGAERLKAGLTLFEWTGDTLLVHFAHLWIAVKLK